MKKRINPDLAAAKLERRLVETIGDELTQYEDHGSGIETAKLVISAVSGTLVHAWLAALANEKVPLARRLKLVADGIRDAPWEQVVMETMEERGELVDDAQANN